MATDFAHGEWLDFEAVTSAAEAATGLSDWGDALFLTSIRNFCAAVESQAEVRPSSRPALRERLLDLLEARLRIVDDRKCDPAIAVQEIPTPLFVLGLPRAGSTFLNHLLGAVPGNRTSRLWEALIPSPPPRAETYEDDPRIAIAQDKLERHGFTALDLRELHPFAARNPESMAYLTDLGGHLHWGAALHIPSYDAFLATLSESQVFAEQRKVLQHLQTHTPCDRWVLKSHLRLDGVLSAYPDARVVINHRDPAKVIPSLVSLLTRERALYSDRPVDGPAFARALVTHFGQSMQALTRQREERRDLDDRIIDITFSELTNTPVETLRKIYRFFGWPLDDAAVDRVKAWLVQDSHGKGNRHRYTLQQYGLTPDDVDACFGKDYLQRYGVNPEEPRGSG